MLFQKEPSLKSSLTQTDAHKQPSPAIMPLLAKVKIQITVLP